MSGSESERTVVRRRLSVASVLLSVLIIAILLLSALMSYLLLRPDSNLENNEADSLPSAGVSTLKPIEVEPTLLACSQAISRVSNFPVTVEQFKAGEYTQEAFALEALVRSETFYAAASTEGISDEFSSWLAAKGNEFALVSDQVFLGSQNDAIENVATFSIAEFDPYCPDFVGTANDEVLPIVVEATTGYLIVGSEGLIGEERLLSCLYVHTGAELAKAAGIESAVFSAYVRQGNRLLFFDEVKVDLSQNAVGQTFYGDEIVLDITSADGFGAFESFLVGMDKLPPDGDVIAGCSKQYFGEFDFPRVHDRVYLIDEVLTGAGLR